MKKDSRSVEAPAHYSELRNWNISVKEVSCLTNTAISRVILFGSKYEYLSSQLSKGFKNVVLQKTSEFKQSSFSFKKLNLFCRLHLLLLLLFISVSISIAQIKYSGCFKVLQNNTNGKATAFEMDYAQNTSKISMDLLAVRCSLKWNMGHKNWSAYSRHF